IKETNEYKLLNDAIGQQDQILTFVQDVYVTVQTLEKNFSILKKSMDEDARNLSTIEKTSAAANLEAVSAMVMETPQNDDYNDESLGVSPYNSITVSQPTTASKTKIIFKSKNNIKQTSPPPSPLLSSPTSKLSLSEVTINVSI
ncbi:unnamed protein product, partial [Didymodactylos carnosus]